MAELFGAVGVNESMAALLAGSASCWDWARLALERPRADDVRAFRSVAQSLLACLAGPSPPVAGPWPAEADLCCQYMKLCRRVRSAFRQAHNLSAAGSAAAPTAQPPPCVVRRAKEAMRMRGYLVRPVLACGLVAASVGRHLAKAHGTPAMSVLRIVSAISRLLTSDFPAHALMVHRVSMKELRPAHARDKAEELAGASAGTIIAWDGRLVEVVRRLCTVDAERVAAAIDCEPWYSIGKEAWPASSLPDFAEHVRRRGAMAWHAARLHHRCRLLFAPDACCESIGSLIRRHWDPERGLSPAEVADGVFLAQAHVSCVGGPRDESLVDAVVQTLAQTSRYQARSTRTGELAPYIIEEQTSALEASGRLAGSFSARLPKELAAVSTAAGRAAHLARRRRLSRGAVLPQVLSDSLRGSRSSQQVVKPLPASLSVLHARQRGVAPSVELKRKKDWMDSAVGSEWAAQRRRLMQADDPEEA